MPRFEGSVERVLTIRAPIQKVVETMANPERFSRFIDDLERLETVEEGTTFRWILKEISEKGINFKGDYTVRYERDGERQVTWSTVPGGNMTSEGHARFSSPDAGLTRVEYREHIVTDMDVNRLLAKVIKPIVDRQIARGVGGYLDRVQAHLEG